MKKPVVLIMFNRPTTTAKVFEKIREYAPEQLFVVADGPRPHKEQEAELCQKTRDVIHVDWTCDTTTIYSERNLGCKQRVYTGLNEVFSKVEEAIILEDDCVPHIDFFGYCETMLDYYKNESKIVCISGFNATPEEPDMEESYSFTIIPESWGWATWKRAWAEMDLHMKDWPEYKQSKEFDERSYDLFFKLHWQQKFDDVYNGKIDSWAYPWMFSCWKGNKLTVLPKRNMIYNIGFSEMATHTKILDPLLAELAVHPVEYPLVHPVRIVQNFKADYYAFEYLHGIHLFKHHAYMALLKKQLEYDLKNETSIIEHFNPDSQIYLFGTGDWGRDLKALLEQKGFNICAFLKSKADLNEMLEGVPVYGLENRTLEQGTIISSIEGPHDRAILEMLRERFLEADIYSWKDILVNKLLV